MANSRNLFDPWIILWAADQWELEHGHKTPQENSGVLLPPPQCEPHPGRPHDSCGRLAEAIGVNRRTLLRNMLDRVQTVDSWLFRMRQIQADSRKKPVAVATSGNGAERKQA